MSRFEYATLGAKSEPLMAYCLDETGRDVAVIGPVSSVRVISDILTDVATTRALQRIPTLNLRSLQLRTAPPGEMGVYNRLLAEHHAVRLDSGQTISRGQMLKANFFFEGRETVLQGTATDIAIRAVRSHGFSPTDVKDEPQGVTWSNAAGSQRLTIHHMTMDQSPVITAELNRAQAYNTKLERVLEQSRSTERGEPTQSPQGR